MKKFLSIFAIAAMALFAVSCDAEEEGDSGYTPASAAEDAAGLVSKFSYDGDDIEFTYNSDNNPTKAVDSYGYTYTYTYSNSSVIIKVGSSPALIANINSKGYISSIYSYDESGVMNSTPSMTFTYSGDYISQSVINYDNDYSVTSDVSWTSGNITSVMLTCVDDKTVYAYKSFEYDTTVTPSQSSMCIAFYYSHGGEYVTMLPSSWFGAMPLNVLTTQTRLNEVYSKENATSASVDKETTFTYEYDSNYITKCTGSNGEVIKLTY